MLPVSNGACLCSHHHVLVHEGGYTIQRVDNNDQRLNEHFVRQQRTSDNSMFEFETTLRNSRESFNTVRKLSPTRYRFRIIDAQGKDILDRPNAGIDDARNGPDYCRIAPVPRMGIHPRCGSMHVDCREPAPNDYYTGNKNANRPPQTFEALHSCTPVPRMGI